MASGEPGMGGNNPRRAFVIGAGISGLAAATQLAARGIAVTLYEAAGQAGGRCRSYYDPAMDQVIDNGNHLVLSGNGAVARYLERIGARGALTGPSRAIFPFADLKTDERWVLRLEWRPAALVDHLARPARAGHQARRLCRLWQADVRRPPRHRRRNRAGQGCPVGPVDAAVPAGGIEHRAGIRFGAAGRAGHARDFGARRPCLPSAHRHADTRCRLHRSGFGFSGKERRQGRAWQALAHPGVGQSRCPGAGIFRCHGAAERPRHGGAGGAALGGEGTGARSDRARPNSAPSSMPIFACPRPKARRPSWA